MDDVIHERCPMCLCKQICLFYEVEIILVRGEEVIDKQKTNKIIGFYAILLLFPLGYGYATYAVGYVA